MVTGSLMDDKSVSYAGYCSSLTILTDLGAQVW